MNGCGVNIWLYGPTTTADHAVPDKNPALIILCTWLGGATPRRIRKYVGQHHQLFPGSAILLIKTGMIDITVRSFSAIRSRLKPAREVIRRILALHAGGTEKTSRGVLLHIFSHGGSNIALQLILSCKIPNTRAASTDFPCKPLLFPAIGIVTGLQTLGVMSSIGEMQKQLNDSLVISARVPRLYLFSKADETIHWEEVQAHLDDAKIRGYNVSSVIFHKSPHCSLIVEDEKRYWVAIQRFWEHIVKLWCRV
ncbi:hypothetical protein BDW72DRAFT_200321 [Aspergillus terricola var. indicus]